MKKLTLTIAIILGLGLSTFAQEPLHKGGLFQRGDEPGLFFRFDEEELPFLPNEHGSEEDTNGPLGSGIAVLVGLGAAYLLGKKHKENE